MLGTLAPEVGALLPLGCHGMPAALAGASTASSESASKMAAAVVRSVLWRCGRSPAVTPLGRTWRGRWRLYSSPGSRRPPSSSSTAAGSGSLWAPPALQSSEQLFVLRGSPGGLSSGSSGEEEDGLEGSGGDEIPGSGSGSGSGSDSGAPPVVTALAPLMVPERVPHVPLIAVSRNPVFPRFIKIIEVTYPSSPPSPISHPICIGRAKWESVYSSWTGDGRLDLRVEGLRFCSLGKRLPGMRRRICFGDLAI